MVPSLQITRVVSYSYVLLLTDLAGLVLACGTVGDAGGAAVEIFEDHFLVLDDQLTDTACEEDRPTQPRVFFK